MVFSVKVRTVITIAAIIVFSYCGGMFYLAYDLLHPWRMPLQDYQKEWLENQASHGLKITLYGCGGGRLPCLMVSPSGKPGERGALLRKQLKEVGITLQPYGKTQGILVLLHGRHGRKENLLPAAERFAAVGFNSVVPDMPAHGDNRAELSGFSVGKGEDRLAAIVLNDARQFFNDATSPAGLWGLSMGGAYASHAAAQYPNLWQVIVIVSSFDSLMGVIEDKFAAYSVPVPAVGKKLLTLFSEYLGNVDFSDVTPTAWAQTVNIPVLIAHGNEDKLIYLFRGKRLYDSFNSRRKQWLEIKGAGHNNILVTEAPLYAEMSRWLLQQSHSLTQK